MSLGKAILGKMVLAADEYQGIAIYRARTFYMLLPKLRRGKTNKQPSESSKSNFHMFWWYSTCYIKSSLQFWISMADSTFNGKGLWAK